MGTAVDLDAITTGAPFDGRARILRVSGHAGPMPNVLVCVPARDEAERLAPTLDALNASLGALDASLGTSGGPAGILLVVNNTSDASAAVGGRWAAGRARPVTVVEAALDPLIADAGHARRLTLDIGARLACGGDAVLLSTDADTRVAPDWAARMVAHLRHGAGLAAGMIDVEPDEFAALPPHVHAIEALERELLREHARAWALLVPGEPVSLGLRVGGASLAVSRAAYMRVGGLPAIASSEDRGMVELMLRHDERVVFDPRALVRTSCRIEARATGGMAGMLQRRVTEADPFCDQALRPALGFAAACLTWRWLREVRRDGQHRAGPFAPPPAALATRVALLAGLDTDDLFAAAGRPHGLSWADLAPKLATPRLRASDVRREIDRARDLRTRLADQSEADPSFPGMLVAVEGFAAVRPDVLSVLASERRPSSLTQALP